MDAVRVEVGAGERVEVKGAVWEGLATERSGVSQLAQEALSADRVRSSPNFYGMIRMN